MDYLWYIFLIVYNSTYLNEKSSKSKLNFGLYYVHKLAYFIHFLYICEPSGKTCLLCTSHCIFVFVSDECDNLEPLVMVQYHNFTGDEHEIVKLPHGNLKGRYSI